MGLYVGAASSETDGETYDAETDFDEFDDWNYQEMFSSMYVFMFTNVSTDTRIYPFTMF